MTHTVRRIDLKDIQADTYTHAKSAVSIYICMHEWMYVSTIIKSF